MQDDSALDRAIAMVSDLRSRCDWDRVQTRETLRPYLVEEIHELDAALASNDRDAIRDEVADLLLHLAWQLVLGEELGEFTREEIADRLVAKMRRRHPHLFSLGPKEAWHNLKARERASGAGTLGGLPMTLPPLHLAFRLQERAAAVGFDWPDMTGPADKVREELAEVEAELEQVAPGDAKPTGALTDEVGDLLFAVVNLARKGGVHPGVALDHANRKFRDRFEQLEALANERGVALETAGLERLDDLWDEVKRRSR